MTNKVQIEKELVIKASYYLKSYNRGKAIYNLSKKDQKEIKEIIDKLDSLNT